MDGKVEIHVWVRFGAAAPLFTSLHNTSYPFFRVFFFLIFYYQVRGSFLELQPVSPAVNSRVPPYHRRGCCFLDG